MQRSGRIGGRLNAFQRACIHAVRSTESVLDLASLNAETDAVAFEQGREGLGEVVSGLWQPLWDQGVEGLSDAAARLR